MNFVDTSIMISGLHVYLKILRDIKKYLYILIYLSGGHNTAKLVTKITTSLY